MFVRAYWILVQFGIDPRAMLFSLKGLPRYIKDLIQFRRSYTGCIEFNPCLSDWYKEGGSTKSEYFWQDLLVAKMIYADHPKKHIDIGSRIDGFVSHVASFRNIEVFDVRPVTTQIPGVVFKQANLMDSLVDMTEYCDSLSCLHALEHFGLGRYGDPINTKGFEHGIVNMAALLKNDGVFYLSVPIGIERVEFNANRVFDPRLIINVAANNSLVLSELTVIRSGEEIKKVLLDQETLSDLASNRYALGIFVFHKSLSLSKSKHNDPLNQ
jgi:Caenorhabditis protein of unknown function, DUF268